MSVEILTTPIFDKEFKRLLKKYPSLKKDFLLLRDELLADPKTGNPIGKNCYKIRLAVKSKGKGKSGGLRVITYLLLITEANNKVRRLYLLSVYDKSENDTISDRVLQSLIENIF